MIHNTRRERAALWPRIRSSSEVLWHLWRQTSLRNLRFLIRKWHFLSNCIVVSDKTLRKKKLCMGTYMFCGHLKWIFEGQEWTYTHTRLNRNANVGKINWTVNSWKKLCEYIKFLLLSFFRAVFDTSLAHFSGLDFALCCLPLVGVDLWGPPLRRRECLWETSVAMYNFVFKFVLFENQTNKWESDTNSPPTVQPKFIRKI